MNISNWVLVGHFIRFWNNLYQKVWYVHMGERLANARFTVKYIGRYTKRPVLAQTRIKFYDRQSVTFEYQDKTTKTLQLTTLAVEEFIARLVRHIPDKNFRQIRYYGIYANRAKTHELVKARAILKLTERKRLAIVDWRQRRKRQHGFDPLICGYCGSELRLIKIVYKSRDGPLKEILFE